MSSNIQDGFHSARAKNWRWTQAKTGTWQLEIGFTILDKEGADVGEMRGWFAVTDNTIDKRVEQVMALGYQPKTGDIGQEIGADENGNCFGGLDANEVRVLVKTDADLEGKPRTRVDGIWPQNGSKGARQDADPNALRAFGAQMRGSVMAAVQRAKAAGAAPVQTQRPVNGAPQPRPAPAQRPAPTATRGPGAPRNNAPEAYDPTGGDEDAIPF
jgi:hypothetical protein